MNYPAHALRVVNEQKMVRYCLHKANCLDLTSPPYDYLKIALNGFLCFNKRKPKTPERLYGKEKYEMLLCENKKINLFNKKENSALFYYIGELAIYTSQIPILCKK